MTPYETAFYETLYALDNKYLKNLIVVGGWCPYLYAKHVWRRQAPEIMTMDIDFAVRTMSPDRFSEPVYKKLLASNLIPRRMDMDDDNRFQFAYLAGKSLVPIEFITSPSVLPKGQVSLRTPYVACDPVPEVAMALRANPLHQEIHYKDKRLSVQIASPGSFMIVKTLLLEHRVSIDKIPKDLASVAFVMRYAPAEELPEILADVASFKTRPDVNEAGNILREFIWDESKKGYGMLREYFERWGVPRDRMNEQISETFSPLLAVLAKKGRG